MSGRMGSKNLGAMTHFSLCKSRLCRNQSTQAQSEFEQIIMAKKGSIPTYDVGQPRPISVVVENIKFYCPLLSLTSSLKVTKRIK